MIRKYNSLYVFIAIIVFCCFAHRLTAANYIITGPKLTVVNANILGVDYYYDFMVEADDKSTPQGRWTAANNDAVFSGSTTSTTCKLRWTSTGLKTISFGATSFNIVVIDQSTITYSYDLSGNRISRSIVLRTKSAVETDSAPAIIMPANAVVDTLVVARGAKELFTKDSLPIVALVRTYPNPTKGSVMFDFQCQQSQSMPATVSVFDGNGVLILQNNIIISNGLTPVDFSSLTAGHYIMVLCSNTITKSWNITKIN